MKNTIFFILLAVSLFTASTAVNAQTTTFSKAAGSGSGSIGEFSEWRATVGKTEIGVRDNGSLTRISDGKKLALKLDKGDSFSQNVFVADHAGDLLLHSEVSNGPDGAGVLYRIDGKTFKEKWRAPITSFNLSAGLIEGENAYVTAHGFVGKVDLKTGKFIWKHNDLYRKFTPDGAFNVIETGKIDGNNIIFEELREGRSPARLIVDKSSGKIINASVK